MMPPVAPGRSCPRLEDNIVREMNCDNKLQVYDLEYMPILQALWTYEV